MKDRMAGIWTKVNEKQSLQEAAYRLREQRRSRRGLKLSISAAVGLAIALAPLAGAAQAFAGLL